MTRLSELKAKARREEAAGNHRRAIQLYLQALEEGDAAEYASPDPGLAVRIADLNFREGEPGTAIRYYRQAADQYAEQGLITNAIAVCNKILRVFPYETDCYRTMARLHLEVGLVAEARKNLLRYVDTVTARGELQEARVAMREFLDRVPDEEIAEQLASRLLEDAQKEQAVETLREVWEERVRLGEGTADLESRIRDLLPDASPGSWMIPGEPAEHGATAGRETAAAAPEDAGAPEPEEPEADAEPAAEEAETELEPVEAEIEPESEDVDAEAPEAEEPHPASLTVEDWLTPEIEAAPELAAAIAELQGSMSAEQLEDLEGLEDLEDLEDLDEADLAEELALLEAEKAALEAAAADADEALAEPEPAEPGAEEGRVELEHEEDLAEPEAERVASEEESEEEESEEEEALASGWSAPAEREAERAEVPVHVYQYDVDRPGTEAEEEPFRGWESAEGEAWPGRLELVGRYRELMSRARELAEEFGREPPSWGDEIESDGGARPWSRLPEIETGGEMSEHTENAGMEQHLESDRPEEIEAFGAGWDPWAAEEREAAQEQEAAEEQEAAGETPVSEPGSESPAGVEAEAEEPSAPPASGEPAATAHATGAADTAASNGRVAEEAGQAPAELGEAAELRRGLELLNELLELSPENMELRRRKVKYARRLGDTATLTDAFLSLAHGLADRGSKRGARILYQQVLELSPGEEAARTGLARLDALELQEQRRHGPTAEDLPAATETDREAREELGERLWNEFEMTIRELPWLHAATQSFQAAGPDRQPALETFLMMAHYFMARDQYEKAAAILSSALDLSERGDEELVDILYYLGVARRRLGDPAAARELFERVARVDEDFREALEIVPAHEA